MSVRKNSCNECIVYAQVVKTCYISASLAIKSCTSTPSSRAIKSNVSRLGWLSLVHHFDTVVTFLPSCPASHLLVTHFSTSTTLMRLIFFAITIHF